MTEICTRLLAEGGPAVLFEQPVRADGSIFADPLPGQPVRHGEAGGHGRDAAGPKRPGGGRSTAADLREVGELLAFLRSQSRRAA